MQNKPTVILVVGHNPKAKGASNSETIPRVNEYDYNKEIAEMIGPDISEQTPNIDVQIISGDMSNTRKHNMINDIAKTKNVVLVVDMHLNAGSPTAEYHLIKYARNSVRGEIAAKKFSHGFSTASYFGTSAPGLSTIPAHWPGMKFAGCFPTDRRPPLNQRGEQYAKDQWKYNGSEVLFNTNPPAVITEPFFISNTRFMTKMLWQENKEIFSKIMADAIIAYCFEIECISW